MKIPIPLLLAAILSTPVAAQVVVQAASAQLQPQIGRDAKGYNVCGIRAVVLDEKPTLIEAYDFSINLRADMFGGLLKAGKSTTTRADLIKGKLASRIVMPAPVAFWIAQESDGKALMPSKVIPAETPGYILASGELVQTWQAILAIIHGERMQFAVRYKNQGYDTVVSFAGKLKEEELKPLSACLDGMLERLQSETPETDKD